MIQTRFNTLYICEIKFSKHPVSANVIEEVKSKINNLVIPRNFSYRPILIHVNGVDEEILSQEYFANIIDLATLLDPQMININF